MKKWLSILLVFAMSLAVCGCSGMKKQKSSEYQINLDLDEFSVGYSRIDISPEYAVPMAGFGNTSKRLSQNIQDYLYATSIAVNDGEGHTIVFLTMDLQRASDIIVQTIRPKLAEMTGLPENSFQITGTHTHSGPDVQSGNEIILPYNEMLMERLIQVVMESLEDLKPASMSVGAIEAEGLNFVRHYGHTEEDGSITWFGDNFGAVVLDENTIHASIADPTMHLIKFEREDAQDVCMVSWRAHPHWTGSASLYNISSDYVGTFRDAFELQTGMLFGFYQSAAGNINEKSRITSENLASDYQQHAALLTEYAVKCLDENMEQLETGAINIQEKTLTMQINKTSDPMELSAAKTYQSIYNSTNDKSIANAAAMQMGYSFHSQFHAGAVVTNSKRPDTDSRTYTVITIGDDVAISLAPHEMFDRTMAKVEEASPFKYTLHFGYANGTNTYMPDLQTWETGSYEVDTAIFVAGSAELVEGTFISMLQEMHK